jgi:hypothetical protein
LRQYLYLNGEEERPDQQHADFGILYKARPSLGLMDKFTQAYITCCELAVNEAMNGFNGRLFLKQYLPGKPTKWVTQTWGLTESANGYLLKCDIYKGKKKFDNKSFYGGNNLHNNLQKISGGKWHHIYFDNNFSSTNLTKMLLQQEIYSCGTIRAKRKISQMYLRNQLS